MGAPSINFHPQDQQAWIQASEKNTSQAYSTYVAQWSQGKYVAEAIRRIAQIKEESLWNWAKKQDQIHSLEKYLDLYPEGYYSQEAYERIDQIEELSAWTLASTEDSISGYLEFRRSYQDSQYAEEAAKRIVALVKARSTGAKKGTAPKPECEVALEKATQQDSVLAYRDFLERFPEYSGKDQVNKRIEQLQHRLNSDFQQFEKEVELWDQSVRLNTRYAYQEYLNHFPSGKFSNLAKNRLLSLDQQWRWKHRVLIEEKARGQEVNAQGEILQNVETQNKAAKSLGWIWLLGFFALSALCVWLASYLLPMTIVVGFAAGAHIIMDRGKRITRNESVPYLLGGSLASGTLVYGLLYQFTSHSLLALGGGLLSMIIAGIFLINFFQKQIDKNQ
ncbi:MAG: hypothetical protein NWR72_11300 [Bacteroidia bacterium]|nr:hypothetical protein [Bacteroidia bacterium]